MAHLLLKPIAASGVSLNPYIIKAHYPTEQIIPILKSAFWLLPVLRGRMKGGDKTIY
jgi:hypothetical protein